MDLEQAFKILKENNIGYRKVNKTVPFGHIISESGLNRLRSNLENGGIIISANITDFPDDMSEDIWQVYDEWLDRRDIQDTEDSRKVFLKEYNKKSDCELESEIKNSGYSYSRVYGGYHGNNGVNDSYEPSFIVYCKDRNGELIDFEDLFDFGVKLCKKFFQNSVYIQPPGEKPYYVDKNGRAISRPGPNQTKYNRFEEEFFTTVKRKKNNSQRFTADIKFESLRVKRLSNFERMKARQYGEIVLD